MTSSNPPNVPEDLAVAHAKIEQLRLRARHAPRAVWTLTGMIAAWRELSNEIEAGYELTIYDYTNDLSVRNLLEEVLAALPNGEVKAWVQSEIQAGDASYREVTHQVAKQIQGGADAPWWFFRVPNRIVGERTEDLTAEGER